MIQLSSWSTPNFYLMTNFGSVLQAKAPNFFKILCQNVLNSQYIERFLFKVSVRNTRQSYESRQKLLIYYFHLIKPDHF